MVAVRAANQAPDVSIASELGSLLHTHTLIESPRWRAEARLRLVPALRRYNIATAKLCLELRDDVHGACCPEPLRDRLSELLVSGLTSKPAAALVALVGAFWSRSWRGAATAAVCAGLGVDIADDLVRIVENRVLRLQLQGSIRAGFVVGEEIQFVDDLTTAGSEQSFVPSLILFVRLVDVVWETGAVERIGDVERLLEKLSRNDRPKAVAHLARLSLRFAGPKAAETQLRSIRPRGVRAAGGLLLTRSALAIGALDVAADVTSKIDAELFRERAELDLARGLVDQGRIRDALRMLQRVTSRAVMAERLLLHDEIRLIARSDVSKRLINDEAIRDARPEPAWTILDRKPTLSTCERLHRIASLIRPGLNDRDIAEHVAGIASRNVHTARERGELLRLMETAAVNVRAALLAIRSAKTVRLTDALFAEHVGRRAEAIANAAVRMPVHTELGLCGDGRSVPNDPRSVERALFDEALAMSEHAPRRRRVLIAAAQHCLRSALTEPGSWTQDVIDARLRTLVHLGGDLARDAIAKPLATLPLASGFSMSALEALCALDAPAAGRILLARAAELRAAGTDVDRAFQVVEVYRGLPRGFARAYAKAHGAIQQQRGAGGDQFLFELIERWSRRVVTPFPVLVLECIGDGRLALTTPDQVIDDLQRVAETVSSVPYQELAERLAQEPGTLEAVLLARPARVDRRMEPWTTSKWRNLLGKASSQKRKTVDPLRVQQCARLLGCASAPLMAGELGAIASMTFSIERDEFHVRLLDKRSDILTYLRFADIPVDNCFRSDSKFYHDDDYWTEDAVIDVWRDPLSFCFHVERNAQPCGFCFGGFAEIDGKPAVVLNGLYVRPRSPEVRAAVVTAIEHALCDPLRIKRVGIACEHAGHGPLPSRYAESTVRLTRLRALTGDGRAETAAYDDISYEVNEPTDVTHLWWRSQS